MIVNISIICFICYYLFLSINTWFSVFNLSHRLFKFRSYIFIIHQVFLIWRRCFAFSSWFIFNINVLKHLFLLKDFFTWVYWFSNNRVKRCSFFFSIKSCTGSNWVRINCGKFYLAFLIIIHNFFKIIFILSKWN